MCRGLYNWLLSKGTLRSQHSLAKTQCRENISGVVFSIVFALVASLLTMLSRIQSSCKNGVKFEDAMTQVLSEILQNLQVTNEDNKKSRCRKGSVPAIWYATAEATEERTTTLKKSSKALERRFSEITTSALSTMPALEEEKDNPEQVDISKEIQVDSAEKRKEDEDVGGTSETTTVMQLKKEMKRKLSVFTAPALSTVPSPQSLDEEKVNIDEVDIGPGCQKQGSEEDSTEKLKEDEDIQPRGLISVPVRATLETTIPMQPKKKMGRKFSVFTAPALSATTSLQSLDEEEVSIDEDDIGFGYSAKVFQEVRAHRQRESDDMQLRKRISAPVIGASETTTLEQPKKEMTFSVFTAPALSATPSLQSLDKEEVNSDKVSIGLGCQVKVIDEDDSAEKQRGDVGRRRRISAPVIGTSGTKTLKNKLKRKFSVFPAPALSASPSLQSLVEEKINTDKVDIGLSYQEVSAEKQRGGADIQHRRRRTSAPVKGTSETTTTVKLPKKKTRRRFSLFAAPALSATPSLKSLDEENVSIDNVDIGLGYNDRVIQTDTKKQPRRRRVSAPARTYRETAETTSFKQLKKDLVRKMSRPTVFPDVALPTMPWLADCVEDQMEENFEPVEFNLSFLDNLMKSM